MHLESQVIALLLCNTDLRYVRKVKPWADARATLCVYTPLTTL